MEFERTFLERLKRFGKGHDLDAAHEAYIGLRRHRDDSQISHGIWTVATNRRASDEHRRLVRWESVRDRRGIEPSDQLSDPAVECEIDERDGIIKAAVDHLPALQREVINRHFWSGESIDQIADSLGVSQNTVRSRLRLANDRLYRKLNPFHFLEPNK